MNPKFNVGDMIMVIDYIPESTPKLSFITAKIDLHSNMETYLGEVGHITYRSKNGENDFAYKIDCGGNFWWDEEWLLPIDEDGVSTTTLKNFESNLF